jgi:Uma2 family endonuclease
MAAILAPPETQLITGEELLAMSDIGPCELIDGRIVPMAPAGDEHGFLEFNLGAELRNFVRQGHLGWVLGGEVGIYIRRNPDRVRSADIVFISKERLPRLTGRFLEVTPEVVIEIISPTDRWQEIREKLADYFSIGVEQVWVVEPAGRKVLVYHTPTNVQEFGEPDTLAGEGILAGLSLKIADLFA